MNIRCLVWHHISLTQSFTVVFYFLCILYFCIYFCICTFLCSCVVIYEFCLFQFYYKYVIFCIYDYISCIISQMCHVTQGKWVENIIFILTLRSDDRKCWKCCGSSCAPGSSAEIQEEDSWPVDMDDLLRFSYQVAQGLDFLTAKNVSP